MKTTIAFLLALVANSFCSFGQNAPFVFTNVVVLDSVEAAVMLRNGKQWAIKYNFQDLDTGENAIRGENSFFVYQKGLVSKQVHGKVHYKLFLEIKDNKYRYTFSDFIFHYYKQDKNYKFVPTGKEKPLNEPTVNGWQKTWEQHKKASEEQMKIVIQKLKEDLAQTADKKERHKSATEF